MNYFSRFSRNKFSGSQDNSNLETRLMLAAITPQSSGQDVRDALADNRVAGQAVEINAGDYTTATSRKLLEDVLSGASRVTFNGGDYKINGNIDATLDPNRGLDVTAWGAKFASDGVDGDLFRFEGGDSAKGKALNDATSESDKAELRVDFSWTGGTIDISKSKVTPDGKLTRAREAQKAGEPLLNDDRLGTSLSADAISVVGRPTGSFEHGINSVEIRGLTVRGGGGRGLNGWQRAGGDSGVFITDADYITVENSTFTGLRDAGIYISDKDGDGTENVTIKNNFIQDSYNGVSVKRGIDNAKITENVLVNNVVGASFQPVAGDKTFQGGERSVSRNGVISNNVITSFSNFDGIRIGNAHGRFDNNRIYESTRNTVKVNGTSVKDTSGETTLTSNAIRADNTVLNVAATSIDSASDKIIADAKTALDNRK